MPEIFYKKFYITAHFWYLISLFLIFFVVNMAIRIVGNIFRHTSFRRRVLAVAAKQSFVLLTA
ncbi:hypothetical protein Bresa_00537|uniref:Uncharacterized protein n=1 Tax=Brenneria salicis ATCC 15712 = DSM 30166 TaxID=714314 RepID=A0A366I9J6_9GAMM|nr:hypothetical protein [Brenneria salicis ATCC 15712 = DSM 30166]RBP64790.1 hypothetical protein DES54_10613 [Brenneria salicis ATCC 15712 = DSM 30166]RLM31519.1 hypothetical protein BHG07_04450 [Brenneria salicis ATCC 15712 = DSM 30166]